MNFAGLGNGFSGPRGNFTVAAAPPDTTGAVGPNHYVQMVNSGIAVFTKSGTPVYGPVATNTLWSGFGGGCETNNDGDGSVRYDQMADRWVISQFSVSTTPYLECVAVSTSPDPTGTYNRYSFSYGDFPDYPKFGVWPDAYYVSYNMFAGGSTFTGGTVCALNRAAMLAGTSATQQCFSTGSNYGGVLPASLDGSRLPPAGSPNYVVGLGLNANELAYWKFHVDWTNPANTTFTGPTALATAAFAEACNGGTCIPQPGTTQQLDSLADRVMDRLAYRNFGDHEALVVNDSVAAGPSTGIRWYELRPDTSHNLSIFQQGTYAPDANYRWMGSIAQDQAGDMALGFSVSGSSLYPSIAYTGRLTGDPAGTMPQGEGTIFAGTGSQSGSNLSRWGDYSNMSIDPSDDCTFWYTNEYIPTTGAFNWSTRIGSFKFPGCVATTTNDFSMAAAPSTVTVGQGTSGTSTVSTSTTSGAAQTVNLSASGLPSGASATFSPSSVTSGSSSTLTLDSGTAAPGSYTITVTGSGASATHSTTLTFTIAANDFSIAAAPSAVTVGQGGADSSTISTSTTSGAAQTVNLSASGLPSGATATFTPSSVTSGSSSTLTLNSGNAAPGTYTVTVTGTGTSATHTTSLTFTITANDFNIAAAPTSVSVNQGGSGSSTVSTSTTSGAAQTVNLSASGLPSGATATFSPSSVTSGSSSTLTLNAGTAAPGTYSVTITGSGASATHTTTITFTITANDFSLAASPTSVSVQLGAGSATTISTAVVSGGAQGISLAVSGLPSGVSASFSPPTVTSGGGSTLTLSSGLAATPGTYTVTVTGTGTWQTHSTQVSLVISKASTRLVATPLSVAMSATLTRLDSGAPIAGQTITFAVGTRTCTATTNSAGKATCTNKIVVGLAKKARGYRATFAGTAVYVASSSSAGLTAPVTNAATVPPQRIAALIASGMLATLEM